MHQIYFAHGYRPGEEQLAAYFGSLMRQVGFLPSLDPPSNDVNAAKLERHLGYTDGLVAILPYRETGPSPHILFEIGMAKRAGKPLLVFIDDRIPDTNILQQITHRRFSYSSYVRETTEHMHALHTFKAYVGDSPIPKHQVSNNQRTCLIIGDNTKKKDFQEMLDHQLIGRGYMVLRVNEQINDLSANSDIHSRIVSSNIVLHFADKWSHCDSYVLGAAQARLVPTIQFTEHADFPAREGVPLEYQKRVLSGNSPTKQIEIINKQINIYEEDFIELDFEGKVEQYANLLASEGSKSGKYSADTRQYIIQEFVMGDKYVQNQGIQGRNVNVRRANFAQSWKELQKDHEVDLEAISLALTALYEQLEKELSAREQAEELAAVKNAKEAAEQKNGPKILHWLSQTGKWTLEVANKVAGGILVELIKRSWL